MAKGNGRFCDWISTLPDTILCLILSFLPTKQAVATSVLSKRWQPLWRSVPTLDFEDGIYYHRSKEDYTRLVHSVSTLILHLHHPIHKFRFRCWPPPAVDSFPAHDRISPFNDPANVTIWVNAAVQRRVHHLDLSFNLPFRAPPINLSSIFSCKTLVVLKLKGRRTKLEPISSVYLPSLQVLHLDGLAFSERGCLAELLSGCPVLEDFKEHDLCFESDYLIVDEIVTIVCESVTDREFKTFPKLLRADISTSYPKIMLQVVNNVKFLHINGIESRIFEGTGPYDFPMFHNLTHIELKYVSCYDDWSEVVELLKYCPKLQVLVIYQPYFYVDVSQTEYPPSMLHLKCTEEKFDFARYVTEDSKEDDNMQWRWHKSTALISCAQDIISM